MTHAGVVSTHREVPVDLLNLLTAHIPYSLPLLRRLQFTRVPGGITEHARVLFVADRPTPPAQQQQQQQQQQQPPVEGHDEEGDMTFTAAYVDLSRSPETQVWLYSSAERAVATGGWASGAQAQLVGDQGLAVLRAMKAVRDAYEAEHGVPSGPPAAEDEDEERRKKCDRLGMIGSLSSTVRAILATRGCAFPYCAAYDMWMFRTDRLPHVDVQVEMESRGLQFGRARIEDFPLVISRTKIPKQADTLSRLPSAIMRREDGTAIAWCFLGPDGALSTMHCEEPYRGRHLAKALAVKLIREHACEDGDSYCFAHVAPDNVSSQGVCRSLGGELMWTVSWSRVDLDSIPN